jgi:hypothetical protein
MKIDSALRDIRNRTDRFPELASSHHFTFDRHLPDNSGKPELAVIGMNPGLSAAEASLDTDTNYQRCHEESSRHDFRHGKLPHNTKRWFSNIREYCGTSNVTTTEFFFWSSKNTGNDFARQFGCKFAKSKHLPFCRDMNQMLIESYPIKLLVSPGLGSIKFARRLYGMKRTDCIRCPETNHRLVERFRWGELTWLFTKHWTGAHGFSNAQRNIVREQIRLALRDNL